MTLTTEQLTALARPFPADAIDWKPGATNSDKTKALALAYVDLRRYFDRLDEIAPGDWADDYDVLADGTIVKCRLSIAGVTRCDVGQKDESDQNTTTAAAAQAFKRVCAKFGLGRHLYDMPQIWADYDGHRKRFSEDGLNKLRIAAQHAAGSTVPSKGATSPVGKPQDTTAGIAVNATQKAPESRSDSGRSVGQQASNGTTTKVEKAKRPNWRNPDEAKSWALNMGAFDHVKHCRNAYDKLRRDALASEAPPTSAAEFFDLWYADVFRRLNTAQDKQTAAELPRF